MLEVQKYLQSNSLDKLTEEFAIKVRRHSKYPNLVGLVYCQIDSPKLHPIVRECRGIILDKTDNWNVVAYPLKRFFNYLEEGAEEIDWTTATTYTKLDGSLLYFFHYNNEWLVATKGSPDASGGVSDFGFTFSELAWDVFNKEGYSTDNFYKKHTYCFELTTPYNKVIVPHNECKLTLLAVRDNITLKEFNLSIFNHDFKLVQSLSLNSWDSILSALQTLEGQHNEGFVVCDGNFNRVKVKHPTYVALSHLKEGLSKRRLLEIIKNNEGDEFLLYFKEFTKLYNELKEKYINLVNSIEASWNQYKHITDQKEFALSIKNLRYKGILFNLKKGKVTSAKEVLSELLIKSLEEMIEL